MTASPELSLVFPLYNEADNIPRVIPDLVKMLAATGIDYELVLVDNGSRDATGALLRDLAAENPRLKITAVEVNQGYGWGIICGLREAKGRFLGFMGSDGQISPKDVYQVYALIKEGGCDLAKVKRVTRHDGVLRKLQSVVYNILFSALFCLDSQDINGTPKIFARERLADFDPQSKDWFLDAELMIKARFLGMKVREQEVAFLPRAGGKSNVRFSTMLEFFRNMFLYRWGGKLKKWQVSRL